ncbi:MAG: galactose-1-phosphate uridylyltransferase [Methylotenera sp.]|nr:galactose-1-phosphate uridylyltransferase [Oligoflexia bacterium]
MHKVILKKPDGRNLHLYSRKPIPDGIEAPTPNANPVLANPHLRWNPLRGEWVAYASHRQNRTFLPPAEYNPLAPIRSKEFPTELPQGAYDIAVFENLFPSLSPHAHEDPAHGAKDLYVEVKPAIGSCEVVVFSQDSSTTLGQMELSHIELLLEVWADRYVEIGSRKEIQYVMPFENRGVEVGVTLNHPHGQIYSYPFIPPVAARELQNQKDHFDRTGRVLLEDVIRDEIQDGRRMICDFEKAVCFVPAFARYTYETWVAPKRASPSLATLTREERRDFAKALKTIALKYDRMWNKTMPYLMVIRQAPTQGLEYPSVHVHAQFYPALRTPDRLKYLAGTETGAGMFANDSIPEEKAAELKAVEVTL